MPQYDFRSTDARHAQTRVESLIAAQQTGPARNMLTHVNQLLLIYHSYLVHGNDADIVAVMDKIDNGPHVPTPTALAMLPYIAVMLEVPVAFDFFGDADSDAKRAFAAFKKELEQHGNP